jgi:acetylornithine deacetylase/succinyl-diaminopimelate desuccinylase-like protein
MTHPSKRLIKRYSAKEKSDGFVNGWARSMRARHILAVLNRCAAAAVLLLMSPAAGEPQKFEPTAIQKAAQASFPEFLALLSLPNDAVNAADIRKNVDWLETAFQKRGFNTRQLPNNGKPLVFAEYRGKIDHAKTILFYMHFDGQPVVPEKWAQESPWIPAVKRLKANADAKPAPLRTFTLVQNISSNQWEVADPHVLYEETLDPELRIFSRSSSDDKAPIMMFLAAFDLLKEKGIEPAINVKVLLDSEEEKNSPGIAAVTAANRDLLQADAILIHDGPMHVSNRPTMIFGNRGVTFLRLTVYGPKSDLHSGHYGNYVPNPAQRLAALLASMKDGDGRVKVGGYYDGIHLTETERQMLAAVPEDEEALKKRVGIAKSEKVGHNYQEALQYPSLNIRGLSSGQVGEKASNIIPATATAELDLRTTPGASATYLTAALQDHIRAQGYYLIDREPTDEERAAHDKIAAVSVGDGSDAAFTDAGAAAGAWVQTALEKAFAQGNEPPQIVRIRMMGGSVPTDKLVGTLDLPFVIVPLVNPDNNQHTHNENLRVGHYLQGIRAFTGLLQMPF